MRTPSRGKGAGWQNRQHQTREENPTTPPRRSPSRWRSVEVRSPGRARTAGLEIQWYDPDRRVYVKLRLPKFAVACILIVLVALIVSVSSGQVPLKELFSLVRFIFLV